MEEKTLQTRTIYEGRVLRLDLLDVELESGIRSTREIIRHSGAVVVIPELPDGRFVLVRQYRKPLDREMVEAVAGLLEEGESPDLCAAREVREETGYCVESIHELGTLFSSPGYTDERLHVFYARLSSSQSEPCLDHDENVEAVYCSRDQLEMMLVNGEITDAKTVAAWFLYEKKAKETS